jgi:hypothetical protein
MTDVHLENLHALMRLSRAEFQQHLGEFALLVQGQVTAYFASNSEALRAALLRHAPGEFSVLRVEPLPADFGFLSCAEDHREAR